MSLRERSAFSTEVNPVLSNCTTPEISTFTNALLGGGRTQIPYLKVTGSDDAISLQFFDIREVQRACLATGWRFAE